MKKVINANLETVQRKSVRDIASNETEDSRAVKSVYCSARVQAYGAKKVIVRDRRGSESHGMLPYVRISGEHYRADDAWQDAHMRLSGPPV